MPMLTVLLAAEPSNTLADAVASLLTGAAAEVLGVARSTACEACTQRHLCCKAVQPGD